MPVQLVSDFDQIRESWVKKPMDFLTSADLSPTGDRVALTARGQVFVAPVKKGRIVEATRKPGVRYREARFLPDGKSLFALSDETGEVEVWKLPANGVGKPEQLTSDGKVLRWEAVASPDGRCIAHHDKDQQLWLLDTKTEEADPHRHLHRRRLPGPHLVPRQPLARLRRCPVANSFNRIFLYRVETGADRAR